MTAAAVRQRKYGFARRRNARCTTLEPGTGLKTVRKKNARMSQKYTQEDFLKMYEHLKQGASTETVAAEYGVSLRYLMARLLKMGLSVKALRMEQHRAKVMEMYERYRQGATYEQIAQEYYYSGGNVVSRMFFKDNDLPRLGRPEKRKAAYEREQKS